VSSLETWLEDRALHPILHTSNEVDMKTFNSVSRLAAASLILVAAACSDSMPGPTAAPQGDPSAALGSLPPQAQDRMEVLFRRLAPEVLSLPGTVFADNDEVAGHLVFGVENAGVGRSVRATLARLGVAEADYAVEVTPPVHQLATLRDKFLPTKAGIQIHFSQYVCTMGFNIDGGTKGGASFGRSFITNSHCTKSQGGTEGTLYYQPTSSLSGVIATEADDPQYFKGGVCPRGKKCRYSDAARALYASGTSSSRGEIARTTGVNNKSIELDESNPFFSVTSQNTSATPAAVGATVNKVGRTTGWTRGTVTKTCVHTAVFGSQVVQLCQTWVNNAGTAIVGGGDSGSSVWMSNGSGVSLVGLLWGGSSDNRTFIFSPLGQIQQELGTFSAVR
jgi:hypothetical protein